MNNIFDWILEAGLRASLLVPVVLVAQWLLRKQLPATWRYALWLPVLVALLVPALPILPSSLAQRLSPSEVPATTMSEEAPAAHPSAGTFVPDAPTAPVVTQESLSAEPSRPSARNVSGLSASSPDSTSNIDSPATMVTHPPAPVDWRVIALWAWLVGSLATGLSIVASFVVTMRRVKRTALPVHPDLLAQVKHLAEAAGLRRVPRVRESPAVSSPAVCGFWRPVLLLNERFEADLSKDEMDMILRHELAHIRRGDLPLNALQCALLAVHWFNPLLWLAFLRARADREAACDESVLRGESADRRAAYGHTLLKMESAFAPSGLCLGFVGILQGGGALRTRIQSIIARRRLNVLSAVTVATGIAGIAVLGVTGVAAEPEAVNPQADSAKRGKMADPPLFVVKVNGKAGFINADGKLVIPATFQHAYPFQDGLAPVQVKDRWGFIDAGGRMVIEPRFAMVGFFSEGLAAFRNAFNQPWGYINRTGEVVLEPRFDTAEEFRKGVAKVGFETTRGKLLAYLADARLVPLNYRFIDRKGEFVEDPGPTRFATGSPGELIPFMKDEKMGYVDATGNVVIPPQFTSVLGFSDGLACASTGGLYGYIDRTGKFVIPPRFPYSNDFSEGLAGVPLGDKGWGFIDHTGKTVIPPRFNWIYGGFQHGIVRVALDGKAGYINTKGEWVWQPSE
ncbi:MAG: WG repeat-containing protein [Luteolibacter sp.]